MEVTSIAVWGFLPEMLAKPNHQDSQFERWNTIGLLSCGWKKIKQFLSHSRNIYIYYNASFLKRMHHNSTIFLQPLNFAKMSDDILYHEKFRWFFFSSQTRKGQAAPPTPTQHSVGNGLGHREMKNPRYRKIAEKHLQSKSARTWKKTLSVSQFGKNDWDGFWGRVSCETEKVWGVHSTLLLNVRWKQIHSYIYIYCTLSNAVFGLYINDANTTGLVKEQSLETNIV